MSLRFIGGFVETTALREFLGQEVLQSDSAPYHWWSPHRALDMFEFLAGPIDTDRPKFVFAHIIKPHSPYNSDQYGNYIGDGRGFDDSHDPGVPSAYIGQLKYVSRRTLEVIDGILRNSDPDLPVIVIASDHGEEFTEENKHPILSAYHLPSDGNRDLTPSISLVNAFRYILDYYFDLNLGLLETRTFSIPDTTFDFRG